MIGVVADSPGSSQSSATPSSGSDDVPSCAASVADGLLGCRKQ